MGRGRNGAFSQSVKKEDRKWVMSEKYKQVFIDGIKNTCKQKVVVMPEDVLNELRQIDPREFVTSHAKTYTNGHPFERLKAFAYRLSSVQDQ